MSAFVGPLRTAALSLLVLVSFGIMSPAFSQVGGAANISGAITDDSGGALPGVTITITNTANGRARTVVTGDDGQIGRAHV